MIIFILLATLLTTGVLLLVLLPLRNLSAKTKSASVAVNIGLYRDQLRELDEDLAAGTIDRKRHAEARTELERRLLEDTQGETAAPPPSPNSSRSVRHAVLITAILLPVVTAGIYLSTGAHEAMNQEAALPGGTHAVTAQQIEQMAAKLAAQLKQSPEDGEGWVMLGRSYAALQRFKEASTAYAEAAARLPSDAQVLVEYADALAMTHGKELAGETKKLVQRALEIDPGNPKALAMAGTIAFDNQDFTKAVSYWEQLTTALPPESEIAASVRASIAEARQLASKKSDTARTAKSVSPTRSSVSGTIRITDNLKARLSPEDPLFIFARPKDGPLAPLAVLRKRAADLPLTFKLDDSMAMAPGMNLSRFGTVIVGARISKSGVAGRRPGDIEGHSKPVKIGATEVVIVIDTEVR